jgi:hypothetical protein
MPIFLLTNANNYARMSYYVLVANTLLLSSLLLSNCMTAEERVDCYCEQENAAAFNHIGCKSVVHSADSQCYSNID